MNMVQVLPDGTQRREPSAASPPQMRVQQSLRGSSYGVGILVGLAGGCVGVVLPGLSSVGLRPWHILVLAAFALAWSQSTRKSLRALRVTSLDYLTVLVAIGSLFSEMLNAPDLGYRYDIGTVAAPIYYLIGYFAVRLAASSQADVTKILRGIVVSGIPLALVAGIQVGSASFSAAVLRVAPGPGLEARLADGRLIRATSLVGHWTGSGFFFCAVLAAACALCLRGAAGTKDRIIGYSGMAVAFIGVLSSLTLSAIVTSLFIVSLFLIQLKIRIGVLVVGAAVLCGVYLRYGSLLSERIDQQTAYRAAYVPSWVPNTIAYRWRIWSEQTIPVISDRLLTGYGSNLYASRVRPSRLVWHSPESQWFGITISYGLFVAILLALTVASMLVLTVRASMARDGGSSLLPIVALVCGAAAASFTVPVFTNRGLPVILYSLLGVCAVALSLSKTRYGKGGDI